MGQKVNKSYAELMGLVANLNVLLSNKEAANSKAGKKLQKLGAKVKSHLDTYNERVDDLRLDNAHTDADGVLALDEKGGYKFTKDGLKALNKKTKELLDETFEFYQLDFSIEGLEDYKFLSGWVAGIETPEVSEEE